MDTATKKIVNHAINHLSDRQFLVRTADDWNDLESAKHILRELRDHGEVYLHSNLDYDATYRMVCLDNPSLGLDQSLATTARIIAHPAVPGACVHQMPDGMSSVLYGRCIRCGSSL